jgi:hypothetical protein
MAFDPRLQTPLVLAGFGVVFVAVAAILASSLDDPPTADTLVDAPAADAAALTGLAAGTTVLIEGRIAAGSATPGEGFVAFERQSAQGETRPGSNDVRFGWVLQARTAPPFVLETATGPVRIANADYELREPPHQSPASLGTVTAGTIRTVGFRPGDVVTVQGAVGADSARGALTALVVRGGDRAAFVRGEQGSAVVPGVMAALFGLFGVGALVAAIRGARRVLAVPPG